MVISLVGPSGIKCQVADFSLLVNPPAKRKGNLTIYTQFEPEEESLLPGEDMIVGQGEYEVGGIRIKGIQTPDSDQKKIKTAYAVHFDDIRLGFLNSLGTHLGDEIIDKLGGIDILFVDIEASGLSVKEIASLIKKVEPAIVVPATGKGAKALLEEFGQKTTQEEKLTIKAKDINPEEGMKIVWLKE